MVLEIKNSLKRSREIQIVCRGVEKNGGKTGSPATCIHIEWFCKSVSVCFSNKKAHTAQWNFERLSKKYPSTHRATRRDITIFKFLIKSLIFEFAHVFQIWAAKNKCLVMRILAETLKLEGMSQQEMYRLLDEYRARHEHDKDEKCYNAILDVMDFITGWCSPHSKLFDTELQT